MSRPTGIRNCGGSNPGEEEIGEDVMWYMKLEEGLKAQDVPSSLKDAALPMLPLLQEKPHLRGLSEDLLVKHLERCVRKMDVQRASMEQGDQIDPEYAGCINSYTDESMPLYRIMSGELFCVATRLEENGELSERVKLVLPYAKFLDVSLKSLPSKYVCRGKAYRAVRWAFPSLRSHGSLHRYFHKGRQFWWFEAKSLSYDLDFLKKSGFCGEFGARTIFEVHVEKAYMIEEFSNMDYEKEVVLPMLTELEVVQVKHRLKLDASCLDNVNSSSHTGEPDIVELHQIAVAGEASEMPRPRLASSGWGRGVGGGKTACFAQLDEAAMIEALLRTKTAMMRGRHFGQAFLSLQQLTNSSTPIEDFHFDGCGQEALTEFFAYLDDEIKVKILEGM